MGKAAKVLASRAYFAAKSAEELNYYSKGKIITKVIGGAKRVRTSHPKFPLKINFVAV
ncbi:hypothetical protein ATU3C_01680 [Agrobacterium genomosp. 3 str. RTP8]|uniref:hypothetical protein n=1 Tax=Agrobacterium tomkonis TaxID=1183410 RepID=UPI001CDA4EA6|nr:hypothetical protein [Agrobacterium tomkonis RTP8]